MNQLTKSNYFRGQCNSKMGLLVDKWGERVM